MQQAPRILIVDDEPGLRLILSAILGQEGFQVTAASTFAEALALITASSYDVLVSDLNIGQPGDGFTVVSAMRRVQPEAVTLILTGFTAFESALRAIREQVDDFLTKPADVRELVTSIKDKLERPRRQLEVSSKRPPKLSPNTRKTSWRTGSDRWNRIPRSRGSAYHGKNGSTTWWRCWTN